MSYFDKVPFIPGLDLSEKFFFDLVKPLLDKHFPSLVYTACRLGPGSDVLGFDTDQSRDHDWGPKFDLLLNSSNSIDELKTFFDEKLRGQYIVGYSTQFEIFEEQDGQKVLINVLSDNERTCHGIRLVTVKDFFLDYLNWSIDSGEPTYEDWLTFPSQHLLTIARGRIFYDSPQLNVQQIRSRLAFYPQEIWFYLMGCCWQRIGQEEHLMGRAGQVGDELGSSLIANRLVRDLMRLIFLLEKQFYPYPKWFGSAFRKWTKNGPQLEPILRQIQRAETWQEREQHFNQVYERVATLFQTIVSTPINTTISQFHQRPFRVINGGAIAEILFSQIDKKILQQLPKIGSVDLFIDNADALSPELRLKMQRIFQ